MFNIILDKLPTEYEGYRINTDFQIGIQISQLIGDNELSEDERLCWALSLLFPTEDEEGNELQIPDMDTAIAGLRWFLGDWIHDNLPKAENTAKVTDYDIDQWRIYAAFLSQYGINLNTAQLHFWEFMGLLQNLEECAYTRVIDIRQRTETGKMGEKEKKALRKAKQIYKLPDAESEMTAEEISAVEKFRQMVKNG